MAMWNFLNNFLNLFVIPIQGLHQFRGTVLAGVPGYALYRPYTVTQNINIILN